MEKGRAYAMTIAGASFWGMTGLFVQKLYTFGFTPLEVVTVRMALSAFLLFAVLLAVRSYQLHIYLRDIPHFIGLGVVSIALFNWCYFTVMEQSSLSIAVVLLYTSPVFVALMSRFIFKEPLTKNKLIAICFTLAGCALVAGLLPGGAPAVEPSILLLGLASGFFCGIYSVIGKFVSRKYSSITITAYSMLCGSIVLLPISGLYSRLHLFQEWEVWVWALGSVLVSTILAYILYTAGLKYIEAGKAAILSTVEPIVAILVGVLVFRDVLTAWQLLGIVLVLSSVLLAIFSKRKKFKETSTVSTAKFTPVSYKK